MPIIRKIATEEYVSAKLETEVAGKVVEELAYAKESGDFKGDVGSQGVQGEQGVQGIQGERGEKGDTGEQGIQGIQGERGEKGDKGDKGDRGETGATGKDGISVTHSWDGTILTITSASGTSSADLKGGDGEPGVGVAGIEQTITSTEDNGDNVITVTMTDGSTSDFVIKNGSKGATGDKGEQGIQGEKGEPGDKGDKGDKGDTGAAGYSPVRGTDYWTADDKAEIKSYVDEAILGGAW